MRIEAVGRWFWSGPAVLAVFLLLSSAGSAAPINYGDFVGDSVVYEQVTESAGPGDETPLYGQPTISGNVLSFPEIQDNAFTASASGGAFDSDTTIGTLSFTLAGTLTNLFVDEGGDFSFLGLGGSEGAVFATLNVQVWDSPAKNTLLASGSNDFSKSFTGPDSDNGFWENSVLIDLTPLGTDSVFVVVNNNLLASVTNGATAFIQKKNFDLSDVPEPSSLVLIGVGGLLLLGRSRTRRSSFNRPR